MVTYIMDHLVLFLLLLFEFVFDAGVLKMASGHIIKNGNPCKLSISDVYNLSMSCSKIERIILVI